jgi:hypothetical protein
MVENGLRWNLMDGWRGFESISRVRRWWWEMMFDKDGRQPR